MKVHDWGPLPIGKILCLWTFSIEGVSKLNLALCNRLLSPKSVLDTQRNNVTRIRYLGSASVNLSYVSHFMHVVQFVAWKFATHLTNELLIRLILFSKQKRYKKDVNVNDQCYFIIIIKQFRARNKMELLLHPKFSWIWTREGCVSSAFLLHKLNILYKWIISQRYAEEKLVWMYQQNSENETLIKAHFACTYHS